jgi:hypothetical protein
LTGHDMQVVIRVDFDQAAGRADLGAQAGPLGRRRAADRDFGAVTAGPREFDRRRVRGHHQHGLDPEGARGVGDGLGVVAARVGDDAFGRSAALKLANALWPPDLKAPIGCNDSSLSRSATRLGRERGARPRPQCAWRNGCRGGNHETDSRPMTNDA